MLRFFIESSQRHDDAIEILGQDAAHLARSLRVRRGEILVAVEDGTLEHGIEVESAGSDRVTGRVVWTRPATGEPGLQVHVIQALPAQGMDEAVAALSEAGAAAIWPVVAGRSVARPEPDRAATRLRRWQTIAREAAQLAGRARAPIVHSVRPLDGAVAALPTGCRILACVTNETADPLRRCALKAELAVAVVIGPEGGLDAGDLALLDATGRSGLVHLGPRVIPSRLAGFLAVSLLLAGAGDLDHPVAPLPGRP